MYRVNPTRRYAGQYRFWIVLLLLLATASCGTQPAPALPPARTPTTSPAIAAHATATPVPTPAAASASATPAVAADLSISIDPAGGRHPISPLIYGLNNPPSDVLHALRPGINRWGGNPSTRYNWRLGNAWNAASDWQYRNGDYGYTGKSASDDFMRDTRDADAAALLTIPTLGWVAKNNDTNTCSFPTDDGQCGDASQANCEKPGAIADPKRANVPIDVQSDLEWLRHLKGALYTPQFVAMDNEPDIWGHTHYDVHPSCTTYDEIRDTYLKYAGAVRAQNPNAQLLGPVSCCWYYYWNSAAGDQDRAAHDGQDFLPWFLQQVRQHDEAAGVRTLDVLDIHYYPEGLYNDDADADTAARRLRSTRSLWDETYVDESWINQPVALIPRMHKLIAQNYPGTKLGITEWNWGADRTMNGALALAEVLGIMGREDVYLANYWRYPEPNSPGFYAFKLFTNYDDQGGHFGNVSLAATSSQPGWVSAFAAQSDGGRLTLLLINKDPQRAATVSLGSPGALPAGQATLFRYSQAAETIVRTTLPGVAPTSLVLPAYSLSLVVIEAK